MNGKWLTGIWLLLLASPSAASCWQVVPANSQLEFVAGQAGGTLRGSFADYSARLCLGDSGDNSTITASVNLASVQTSLPELDQALRGPDFFDVGRWPQGRFFGDRVRRMDREHDYAATGALRLRDVTKTLTVPFTFIPAADGQSARLTSDFDLSRLAFRIGQGQWSDTRWLDDKVKIHIDAVLKPIPGRASGT